MKCTACHAENREGRRFCGECGVPLPAACPSCGFVNDTADKFCGGCGASVTPTSSPPVAPRETQASRAPETVAHDAQEGEHIESGRRHLTVMFCDLVDSTTLSERLDPEEFSEILAAYQDTCAEVINRFGGYIGRYVGDALLIYFGYPKAHEDDSQRAVRTGLGILDAIESLNARVHAPGVNLAVRIGINTGLVVAGDIGKGERRERMAIVGETPNVAARLHALAGPNSVVIGENTHRLVEGLFVADDLGAQQLKGVSDPIRAYRVRQETGLHSRFEAQAARGLTPLVGRKEEIGLLIRRWEQALQGEGQVVMLSGEAGVGKSRILRSVEERIEGESHSRVQYYCSPYHTDTPYYPAIEQLQRSLGFQKHDEEDQKAAKLESALGALGLPVEKFSPLLASFLSVVTGTRYAAISATAPDRKRMTLEALVALYEAMARSEPLILVVEDLHWIDSSTLELLNLLVDGLQATRFMLVNTFRPEFEPPWGDQPHVTLITLNRLSRKDSTALVSTVTGGKPLPDEVLEQILVRTDGVPLFVEELTKTILESDIIRESDGGYELSGALPTLEIPASLHDSLMARLDRLASVKELAQLAATLGRTFSQDLLAAVSQKAETALDNALGQLVEAELIYRRGITPEVLYEFKHALVKDAAYDSLLKSKRQQLHMEIARALEDKFPETVERSPELLSHHYRKAGLAEHAIPHAIRAGDMAATRYAATEATAHFQSALEMARTLPSSDESARTEVEAILKLAKVSMNRAHFQRDLENLECAKELAESTGDKSDLSQVLYWIGRTHYVLGDFNQSIEYAKDSLQIAETLGDDDALTSDPVNLLARVHCLRGEPREASLHAARNVEQMRALGNRVEEAAVAGVLAFGCGLHGRYAEAVEAAHRGIELAQKLEHLPTLAACFMFRGVVRGWYGNTKSASEDYDDCLVLCEKAGDVFRKYLTYGWRGEAYLLADERERAKDDLTQCLDLGDRIGTSFHRGAFQAFLAKLHLLDGDVDTALQQSEVALEAAADSAQAWSRSIAMRVRAEVLLASGSDFIDAAEDAVRTAIDIQDRQECRPDLAQSYLVRGMICAAKGEPQKAEKDFREASSIFEEIGAAHGPTMVSAALANLKHSEARADLE